MAELNTYRIGVDIQPDAHGVWCRVEEVREALAKLQVEVDNSQIRIEDLHSDKHDFHSELTRLRAENARLESAEIAQREMNEGLRIELREQRFANTTLCSLVRDLVAGLEPFAETALRLPCDWKDSELCSPKLWDGDDGQRVATFARYFRADDSAGMTCAGHYRTAAALIQRAEAVGEEKSNEPNEDQIHETH